MAINSNDFEEARTERSSAVWFSGNAKVVKKKTVTISVNIDKMVQTASLQIHDLNGKLLNNLIINDKNNSINKTLQKDNFGNGIYIVSLVVNGKSIDSKKIIFN